MAVPLTGQAAAADNATFVGGAGTYTGGSTVYARSGQPLTLQVTTQSLKGQCADVSLAFADHKTTNSGVDSWTFSTTGATGNGTKTARVDVTTNFNASKCTGNAVATNLQASYTADNAAPSVSPAVAPAPNGVGWNKSDVTVSWPATDQVGGAGVDQVGATFVTAESSSSAGDTVSKTVSDRVGNSTTASVVVKLDKTAPTISGSRNPAANANGWNNSDVTVSFTCADALSGIKSCAAATPLTTNGAAQSVTGTATDNADNTASATVAGINIDKVAPTLSGAPTTSANADGWYSDDVSVAWTATDALSGIASTPANSTITGEGIGLTASASVTDKAGNTTTATSAPAINIDRTAPNTTASAPPAWNNTDVTVSLTASDVLSGVRTTSWSLDGGATQTGTSVPVSAEGDHTLAFWSTDKAGNAEAKKTIHVKIDKTSPTIGHSLSPAPNGNGWNKSPVTVTFTCSDALSGIASCAGSTTVSTDGKTQAVTGTATDNAGNTATDPAVVSLDSVPPKATLTPDRAPNANGWYADDVVLTAACTDALSGVASCTGSTTLGEGKGQSVSATAVDAADNSATATTTGIDVDRTTPGVTFSVPAANANGWYAADVVVTWTCTDALSGIATACPVTSTITGEGEALSASASATDKAGNVGSGSVTGIAIDRQAPTTTLGGAPAGGWQKNPVTLTPSAVDLLSGVDVTYLSVDGKAPVSVDSVTLTDGSHTVEYWSVDKAGNAEARRTVTVQVDTKLPTIAATSTPGPNAAGWNNTPVDVDFGCADQDGLSGIADCSPAAKFTAEGASQTITGTATDYAGNTQSTTATASIDMTPPDVTTAADRAPNEAGWYTAPVTVTATCSDQPGLSGIDACPAPTTFGEGTAQTYGGVATDVAGNATPFSATPVNVDLTAPTLSAAPTTTPNGAGWYNAPVTFEWTCGDAGGSGLVDGTCPAPTTVSTDGKAQSVSASVTDVAGNSTSATSAKVKIDRTAPVTTADAPGGWVNTAVTVSLNAGDNLSGVASTHYTVDGGADQQGTTISLGEGVHELVFWSADEAGNVEEARKATVEVDLTKPRIDFSPAPKPNVAGWNNADVTVTFTCEDDLSGIASCTGPQTVTTEGAAQEVPGEAADEAGNTAATTATVNLDKTAPTITGSASPAANGNGWRNEKVKIDFVCSDALAGVAHCTGDQYVPDTTGAGVSVPGTARDAAGNEATTSVDGVKVDTVLPTISGAPVETANGNGWYSSDVTIRWTCDDDNSGVDTCPADEVLTGEGADLSSAGAVSDLAGNTTSAVSPSVKIDRTPPTTTDDAPSVWRNDDVQVGLVAKDGLSDVAATYYAIDGGDPVTGNLVTVKGNGVHTLEYWSEDLAGNVETRHSVTIRIDTVAPTVSHTVTPAANGKGWINTVPVTVDFSCADEVGGSGLLGGCVPTSTVFAAEGADQTATSTASDVAGNAVADSASVNIDVTPPAVTAAPSREPDSQGWYNQPVSVGFECSDALSGIAACPSPAVVPEGRGRTVSGSATDIAGNSTEATSTKLDVDLTAPTLSGAPTTAPVRNGWYRGAVLIRWTAKDDLSGVTAPGDSLIDAQGEDLTATETVADAAGNSTTEKSAAVKIDSVPPTTHVSAPTAWQKTAVTVSFTAEDTTSGVEATHYRLDDADAVEGTSVDITTDGTHRLEVWSTDVAGNEEAHQTFTVLVDRTGPSITATVTPKANEAGWHRTDPTVSFACQDDTSGVASCTGDVTVTNEGAAQAVPGTAEDNAGNTASTTALVSLDKTTPSITGSVADGATTSYGWYGTPVTVHFACDDQATLSGLADCTGDTSVGEGDGQSVTGHAHDVAGNAASDTVPGLKVDLTKPTIGGAASPAPNTAGWNRSDVTVTWTCGDALSGVAAADCPAATVLGGEGAALGATGTATDRAGNQVTSTVSGIRIDRTAPVTSADAPSGWQQGDTTVTFTVAKDLSGVAATYAKVDNGPAGTGSSVVVRGSGNHTVTFWSVDVAGNAEDARTVSVLLDAVAPTITAAVSPAPNANGWNGSGTVVTFTCADTGGSGIDGSCPSPVSVSQTSATGKVVTGTVKDKAGNSASASVSVKVDTTPPTVTIGGTANGAGYKLGAVPSAKCTASDALSGLAGPCTVKVTGGRSSGVGTFTVTAAATDKAGNTTTVTQTYKVTYVIGVRFFCQPINDTAHEYGLLTSIFKGGSTIPVKFQVFNAQGDPVAMSAPPVWEDPSSAGTSGAALNSSTGGATGDTSATFRWEGSGRQYTYNWNTGKQQVNQYWRVAVRLDDDTTQYVSIGLR